MSDLFRLLFSRAALNNTSHDFSLQNPNGYYQVSNNYIRETQVSDSLIGCRYCLDDDIKCSSIVNDTRNRFILLRIVREIFSNFDAMDINDDYFRDWHSGIQSSPKAH